MAFGEKERIAALSFRRTDLSPAALMSRLWPASSPLVLKQRFLQMVARGRSTWPELALPTDAFLCFVAERIPEGADPVEALGRMNAEGLYIACGCVEADPSAVAYFVEHYFPEIESAVVGTGCSRCAAEDAKQAIFEKLFVGNAETAPRILRYVGQGELSAWLRVVAVHHAIDLLRLQQREEPLDQDLLTTREIDERTPELQLIEERFRSEFRSLFRRALSSLDGGERRLLRHRFVEQQAIAQLSVRYGVHRITVWRRLEHVRKKLSEQLLLELEMVAGMRFELDLASMLE